MRIRLYPEQKGKPLGNLFGLFFEDLNHAADGGLYAELIQNRCAASTPISISAKRRDRKYGCSKMEPYSTIFPGSKR